ncbi:HAD family hydrolase [Paenibacillus thalictri]|uniref:HAD family phosphatase n=1 Tax=Paenibacillus thalictri TaxID=2527873 RepID=A0A4Q9DFV3_9BACL|nr:HAD family hydrolase [Paenibacillus thalictri]TBL70889.1 HAD family phosphatase [Paenibacillus thalictri]
MTNYKLLALDMDGTLLTDSKEISPENARWIAKCKEQGVHVILTTGRGIQKILPYSQQLGLTEPIVAVNGGEVWSGPEQLYQRSPIPAEVIERLRQTALTMDVWYWAYTTEGMVKRDTWGELNCSEYEWLKFGYHTEDPQKLAALHETIAQTWEFEATNSHPCNIELNPKGITKANGLREVCRLLGVEMREAVAVGDSLNDMSMIVEAGLGVAMGNAQEEVKRRAGAVTDSNEEDGVAKVIQRFIL